MDAQPRETRSFVFECGPVMVPVHHERRDQRGKERQNDRDGYCEQRRLHSASDLSPAGCVNPPAGNPKGNLRGNLKEAGADCTFQAASEPPSGQICVAATGAGRGSDGARTVQNRTARRTLPGRLSDPRPLELLWKTVAGKAIFACFAKCQIILERFG
jgi:hypothetical protein